MKKTIKIAFFSVLIFAIGFNACRQLSQQYTINKSKCTSCTKCATVCGYGAIIIKQQAHSITDSEGFTFEYPTTFVIDSTKCVGCGECFKTCPSQAISLSVMSEKDATTGASRVRH